MRLKIFLLALACAIALVAEPRNSVAGSITFNSALPVAKGEFILRGQAVLSRSTDNHASTNRDLRVLTIPTVLAYGVTRNLALFDIVPYLDKTMDFTTLSGRVRRGDSGLGDSTFLARYTILSIDRLGDTRRFAPFVGLKVPTGDDSERDSLGSLPQPLQLGSGSWDPLVGTSFTW